MSSDDNRIQVSAGPKTYSLFFWILIFAAGLAGWLIFISHGESVRAWRALLVNFTFFTPLAAGMIVWPAIASASQGIWAKPLERTAFSSLPFGFVSIISYIVLAAGYKYWAGWVNAENLHMGFWLNFKFVFIRDLAAILFIWILCAAFAAKARKNTQTALSGWLCFSYAVVFTLIAFDMVMALDPHWYSTLFGGYFFVSGMYAALVAWTFLSIVSGVADVERRHDLGKLIVAVSLLTTYLMYSQLLPIWYEDFYHEVRFLIPRMTFSQWRFVSLALLVTIYLGPLVLLLTTWAKRSAIFLGAVSLWLLIWLWVERWWEIMPTLKGTLKFGLIEISITAAFIAAFILCYKIGFKNSASIQHPGGSL